MDLFWSPMKDWFEDLRAGQCNVFFIQVDDFLTAPCLTQAVAQLLQGFFFLLPPNVVFISCSCFGGNNSLTRDIMLDTSQRLYQLSRKPSLNWCNSFSCFRRRRTWNWKNVSQRIKLG